MSQIGKIQIKQIHAQRLTQPFCVTVLNLNNNKCHIAMFPLLFPMELRCCTAVFLNENQTLLTNNDDVMFQCLVNDCFVFQNLWCAEL